MLRPYKGGAGVGNGEESSFHHRGIVSGGARAVHDDGDVVVVFGVALVVVVNGAVGVQELVGDVSQDGSAARGDAAFGDLEERLSSLT